jgi:hypothetical protein
MKTILLTVIGAASILGLSACASHEPAPVTTSTTTETHEVQAVPEPAATTTTETVHTAQ